MGKTLKEILIGIGATITSLANNIYLVPEVMEQCPQMVPVTRDFDHLLARIGTPYLIGLIKKPIEKKFKVKLPSKFLTYAVWASY